MLLPPQARGRQERRGEQGRQATESSTEQRGARTQRSTEQRPLLPRPPERSQHPPETFPALQGGRSADPLPIPLHPLPEAPSAPPRDHHSHLPAGPQLSLRLPRPRSPPRQPRALPQTLRKARAGRPPRGERIPAFLCLPCRRLGSASPPQSASSRPPPGLPALDSSHCSGPAGKSSVLLHPSTQGRCPSFSSALREVPHT